MTDEVDGDLYTASIGQRLREAREAKGLSLEDVAAKTRVPIRHLTHIEAEEWEALPAPTYTVGFVRAYASAVDLDGSVLARELRERLGVARPVQPVPAYYEEADPARVPPRSLAIIAAIIALVLIIGYALWRSQIGDTNADNAAETATRQPAEQERLIPAPPPTQAPAALGPVVITATEEVWLRIYEPGGQRLLEKTMAPGERFIVPETAQAPLIRTGRPHVLRVTVGNTEIPPLGAAEQTILDVSLRPADLLARVQGQLTPPSPVVQRPPTGF